MTKSAMVDFTDVSGGKNNVYPEHALNDNQCVDTLNLIHEATGGVSRAPGYSGIPTTGDGDTKVQNGWFKYVRDDGSEVIIISTADKKLYAYNPVGAEYTEIYTLSGAGTPSAVNACNKLWFVNGTDFVKVEYDLSVYPVQLESPVSGSVSASAGGTLTDGTYTVYAAFVRVDIFGRYLYSYPLSLGDVELGSGDNTIVARVYGSDDSQIDKVVIFCTDADGAVPYYYYEGDAPADSGSYTDYTIADSTDRDELTTMAAVSSSNVPLAISPNCINAFDDRLFVWDYNGKNVYWSLQSDINPFDLERFISSNFRTLKYSLSSMFSIDADLYFNHIGNGVSVAYYGDMASAIKHVQKQFWFLDCNTGDGKTNISYIKGMVFGLTNDGFRFFDGSMFSNDISFNIKPDIDKVYRNLTILPSATVFRRSGKRTEYRFCFQNLDNGSVGNNDQLILNIDSYFSEYPKMSWERWENGFLAMFTLSGNWVGFQASASASCVVRENGSSDINCFNKAGSFVTTNFIKRAYMRSRTVIDSLDTISIWGSIYGMATSNGIIYGNIIILDKGNKHYPFQLSLSDSGEAVLPSASSGLGLALPFFMAPETPSNTVYPMGWDCRGNSVAIEIYQESDDTNFFIYKLQLPRINSERNSLT